MTEKYDHECDNCGEEFKGEYEKMQLCGSCNDERAMRTMAKIEPPEGGWPRVSTMDQL